MNVHITPSKHRQQPWDVVRYSHFYAVYGRGQSLAFAFIEAPEEVLDTLTADTIRDLVTLNLPTT